MKTLQFGVIWLIVLTLVLAACGSSAASTPATSSASVTCTLGFTATVRQGPDTGLSVHGLLQLQSDATGSLTGLLKQKKGPDLKVVGEVKGRAINLIVDLGNNSLLYGVGTLQNDLKTCKGQVGGPLVGPHEGDSGDWGCCPCYPYPDCFENPPPGRVLVPQRLEA